MYTSIYNCILIILSVEKKHKHTQIHLEELYGEF